MGGRGIGLHGSGHTSAIVPPDHEPIPPSLKLSSAGRGTAECLLKYGPGAWGHCCGGVSSCRATDEYLGLDFRHSDRF